MEWVELGEVGIITTGNTPRKKVSEYYTSKHIPFIKPTSFQKDRIVNLKTSDEFLSKLGKEKGRIATKNDVLVTCIGSVGNVGIARNDICFNQQINSIKPYEDIINYKYLAYSIVFINPVLEHIANKAVVPIINKTNFGKIKIPVPSLAIQEQIVEVLDRAQELIDKRRAQIQAMDSLIESIFYSMFGDPVRNEKGWEVKLWDDIFNTTTGKLNSNAMEIDGKYPFFTCAKEIYKINSYSYDCEALLLAGNNASADYDIKYYKGKFDAYQRTYILTLKKYNNYLYFKELLEKYLSEMKKISKGTSTKYLTLKILNTFKLPTPPLDLQNEFAQKVGLIEREKERLEESLELMEENYRSIMDRAFKGELFN